MDVGDLVFRDAFVQQLLFQIVIHIELPVIVGRGQVNKNHLRGFLRRRPFPDAVHIFRTDSNLSRIAVRQHGIDQPLIQCQLPPIVGNDQHIVLIGVYLLAAHLFRTLG